MSSALSFFSSQKTCRYLQNIIEKNVVQQTKFDSQTLLLYMYNLSNNLLVKRPRKSNESCHASPMIQIIPMLNYGSWKLNGTSSLSPQQLIKPIHHLYK